MCGGASGVFLVGDTPEIDMGMYGRGDAREGLTAVAQQAVARRSIPCAASAMLAASTVQVSAAGLLPWQTPQSMAEGIGGTWFDGWPETKPVDDLDGAAVAGLAGRHRHLRVIEERGHPARRRGADAGGMAVLAQIGGGHVIALLAHGLGAVVTADAAGSDARVIEVRAEPGGGQVAIAALERRRDVARVLARGLHAVVADDAEAGYRERDLRVIDRLGRIPAHHRVAGLAIAGWWPDGSVPCPAAIVPLWQLTQLPITSA